MLLSVIIPVYNEVHTVAQLIERVRGVAVEKEIIIVDDYSRDGTRQILKKFEGQPGIQVIYHEKNKGKGAALRTGLRCVKGDLVIFQDADLEYDPEEYPKLMEPIVAGRADVVYGSRFLGAHRAFLFWHFLGNKLLTLMTNVLYNSCLTDMETCYKMFRREVIQSITIESDRFNVEPEITAKVLKRRYRVFEIPITYSGRDFTEGKKITWKDGFSALLALIKYRFRD